MKTSKFIIRALLWIATIIVTIQTVRKWVADVCLISSDSMANTILAGDRIVVRKIAGNSIQRNDLIIFNHPDGGGTQLIKRCIGLPGDTILLHDGDVYINNNFIATPSTVIMPENDYDLEFPLRDLLWTINYYGPVIAPKKGLTVTLDSMNTSLYQHVIQIETTMENPYTVTSNTNYVFKSNCYFVLGDHRGNSIDSRHWGFVADDLIVGKAVMVYFSKNKEKNQIRWNRIGKLL